MDLVMLADIADSRRDSFVRNIPSDEPTTASDSIFDHDYGRSDWSDVLQDHPYSRSNLIRSDENINDDHSYAFRAVDIDDKKESSNTDFACRWQLCKRRFHSVEMLSCHVESHVDPKQRHCEWRECQKWNHRYSQRYLLIRHLRSHTNHKPFQCEHCSSRFSTVLRKNLHVTAIHENEVKYPCEFCEDVFKTTADRRHHVRRRHLQEKFQCDTCGKLFSGCSPLRIHKKKCKNNEELMLKLNPLIAKETATGQIQCLICNTQVKAKIWTAHLNGKKHRDSVAKLKAAASSSKRAPEGENEETPPAKRAKDDQTESDGPVPSNFFDNGNGSTPFQDQKRDKQNAFGADVIEGVPQGFFDNKKMDERTRDTREKNAHFEEEYSRLKNEINEQQQTEEEIKEEEEEAAHLRQLELERIDEQMEKLKRINELEIQKEKRIKAALERRQEKMEEDKEDSDDEEDIDDIEPNWRSKNFF